MKFKFIGTLGTLLSISACISAAGAEELYNIQIDAPITPPSLITISNTDMTPYADKIVYKYRENDDGVLQYRRLNETKQCWVDPYWINI